MCRQGKVPTQTYRTLVIMFLFQGQSHNYVKTSDRSRLRIGMTAKIRGSAGDSYAVILKMQKSARYS